MIIRDETQADHGDIRSLNQAAFGGGYEAALVDRLRSEELVRASLVAVEGGAIVGHILFSALSVTMDGWTVRAAALAPLEHFHLER
jgi:putative acetyltransferase